MSDIAQSDIFFFITSIAVIIGGLLAAIILIYGILIFRDIRAISSRVKKEAEHLADDVDSLRGFLKGIFKPGKKPKS